jgi:hypothetical protein
MVVFLFVDCTGAMTLRDDDCWLRWRFLSENRSREQSDNQADGEWLDERHRRVEERILVHDFEFIDFLGFLLNGSGRGAGGLHLLKDVGAVLVHEVRHEIEVDDFPGDDVKEARDYGDGEADKEGFAESDVPLPHVVAVRTDAKEGQHQGQYDGRIAQDVAVIEVGLVHEGDRGDHQEGGDDAGNQAENENGSFHWLLPNGRLRLRRKFNPDGGGIVVILLDDFVEWGEKSYFWASDLGGEADFFA